MRRHSVETTTRVYSYKNTENLSSSLYFHHNFYYFIFSLKALTHLFWNSTSIHLFGFFCKIVESLLFHSLASRGLTFLHYLPQPVSNRKNKVKIFYFIYFQVTFSKFFFSVRHYENYLLESKFLSLLFPVPKLLTTFHYPYAPS